MESIEVCDVCGSTNLKEIKCKIVCRNCGTILRSCSDLADWTHKAGESLQSRR